MKYRECYQLGKRSLEDSGIAEADWDARLLLEYVCGTTRNDLLAHGDREVEADKEAQYRKLLEKRAGRVPLQHLTGVQEFMGLEFQVNESVLIPRQDTEILVEEVLRELQDGMRILDMCTGSGCILVSLLHYSNDCQGMGADISEAALKTARRNAEGLLKEAALEKVTLVQSDLFERIEGCFDVIVSNPPYIRTAVIEELMPEVKEHEPYQALDGKEDGLFFYRRIVADSTKYLVRGGKLYFEIGFDQAEAVRELMKEAGYSDIQVVKDYAGLDRVVYGNFYPAETRDSNV